MLLSYIYNKEFYMTGINKPRISIRLSPNQELVLREMSEALDTSISMMIRTIVGDWITKNEEFIYRIIDKKKLESDGELEKDTEFDVFG